MIKSKTNRFCALIILSALYCFSQFQLYAQNAEIPADPGARWGHVLIFDPANNNLLLFGGTNKRGGDFFADTWIWQNDQWKKLDVTGPTARGFCAVTFHKARNRILLHGGRGSQGIVYSDLWEWNGRVWSQLQADSEFKADHHQMVYLTDQQSILAFGGWNGEDVSGDTWLWSGEWKKLEGRAPPKRAAFAMAYHESTNRVVLFGGLWINGQYADLWEWHKQQWSPLSGPYDHSSLDHHTLIYDAKSDRIIGFGGKNYRYVPQNVTFSIDQDTIVQLDTQGPAARHSFGFAYDPGPGFGYVYGGKAYVDGQQVPLGDFWKWDGEQWKEIPESKSVPR